LKKLLLVKNDDDTEAPAMPMITTSSASRSPSEADPAMNAAAQT